MSANINKVILIGRITRDIELKYTPKGTAIADLGLATNRSRTDDSGQKHEETTFVDVTLWGRQAELANQYLAKGREVYIEGRLQLDTWQDKQSGQNRSKLRVVGEQMQFIGGAAQGGNAQPQQRQPQQRQPQQRQPQQRQPQQPNYKPNQPTVEVGNDEIPF